MNAKGFSRILKYGENGCDIPYGEIRNITELVKNEYHFSESEFWMWKMFQFGFAYGKQAERIRRKKGADSLVS